MYNCYILWRFYYFSEYLKTSTMSKIYQNPLINSGFMPHFPSCPTQKSKQAMFSCCKMNDWKPRGKERKTSHLHHRSNLPACTLPPADVPDVPLGQKKTRSTCPSTVSQCEIPEHKQLLLMNNSGSVSVCISHLPAAYIFPIYSPQW